MLREDVLLTYEAEFREEAGKYLRTLTTEQASERMKSNYNYEHPFVLWHGGLHGRNIIVSRRSNLDEQWGYAQPEHHVLEIRVTAAMQDPLYDNFHIPMNSAPNVKGCKKDIINCQECLIVSAISITWLDHVLPYINDVCMGGNLRGLHTDENI
ncbi:hypothetical protein EDC04DRAFT_2615106 [Pisolithus marmoratus]|nr:hypothetical protein EDC04DRAFT_2615106 [Pisolithus marmoratus]